ncbi:hypothetical protein [Streptomyces iakyrus]|uniref:hypothetical protein n=1 Tax=Streptomyces iakyrus TaxID=68219 RepID=UPI003D8A9FF3
MRHTPSPACTSSAPAAVAAASGSRAVYRRRAVWASTTAAARPAVHSATAAGCHATGTVSVRTGNAGFSRRPDPSRTVDAMPRTTYPANASSGVASREATTRPTT